MIDLSKPWPFALNRRTAALFLVGFAVAIAALYFFDRPISQWSRDAAQPVRQTFRWITRWGESDWILIPTVLGLLGGWLLSLVTRDRIKLVAQQFATICGFIFVGVGLPSLIVRETIRQLLGRLSDH